MGCCRSKESPLQYLERQQEKLNTKLQAYTGEAGVDRYNLTRAVAVGMQQIRPKKLTGEQKRTCVLQAVVALLVPGSYPEEIKEKVILEMIEDLYVCFHKQLRRKGCC
jgi:hypothetical protein